MLGLELSAYKVILKTDLHSAYTGLFFTRPACLISWLALIGYISHVLVCFGYAGATSSELYNVTCISDVL